MQSTFHLRCCSHSINFNTPKKGKKKRKEKENELFGYTELKRTKRLTTTELKSLCDATCLPRRPKSSHLERQNWTLLYGSCLVVVVVWRQFALI